jgi:hypothetical protein
MADKPDEQGGTAPKLQVMCSFILENMMASACIFFVLLDSLV